MARVQIIHETTIDADAATHSLWFQWCRYIYDDGKIEHGYRFIWRRPKSEGASLQPARGQARIPSVMVLERLVQQAKKEGWSHYDGDRESSEVEAAAKRLRKAGLVVDLDFGYVGWPSQEAAAKGDLTPGMIADEKLIREFIGMERTANGDNLPIAGGIAG